MTPDDGALVGHWPLRGSCRDVSGGGHHGRNRGADLSAPGRDGAPEGAAAFDGRGASVVISGAPGLGAADFSLCCWMYTERLLDDAPGDLVSTFDPATGRGFALGLLTSSGVTSHQPNWRTLHCTVAGGEAEVRWEDCGRPGNAVYVKALAVHAGQLYAATYEAGADEAGHVYRWLGGAEWLDCGAPDRCNSVSALAVADGVLWAGVSRYRAQGSALPESPNIHPGGRVYRYDGGQEWVDAGKLDEGDLVARAGADQTSPYRSPVCDSVAGLATYRGALYATPLYSEGLFRHEGGTTWTYCGSPGCRLMALTMFDGHLYAAGNESGGVLRYDGGAGAAARWTPCGSPARATQVYSFAVYGGRLHAGTWPDGRVFRYEGGQGPDARWADCGRLGQEREVMGMLPYAGRLYAGTLPLAEVYRYEGRKTWARAGRLDRTPDVTYRRAWSMAIYQGRLFCGTLPSGRVHAAAGGQVVTVDHELQPGWRHLAAVRQGGRLTLFVDGRQAASGTWPAALEVAGDQPLRLGSGPYDHFNGRLSDVRLYRGALTGEQIAVLRDAV